MERVLEELYSMEIELYTILSSKLKEF